MYIKRGKLFPFRLLFGSSLNLPQEQTLLYYAPIFSPQEGPCDKKTKIMTEKMTVQVHDLVKYVFTFN